MKLLRALVVVALIASVAGCATFGSSAGRSAVPKYPNAVTEDMQLTFDTASGAYVGGNLKDAYAGYQNYVSSYGYNALTDEARFRLGEIEFMNKRWAEAVGYYKSSYLTLYNPNIAPKAQFKASMSMKNLGQNDQAFALLSEIKRPDLTTLLALRVDSFAIDVGKLLGKPNNSLIKYYLFLLDDYATLRPQDYQGKVREKLVADTTAHKAVADWIHDANVGLSEVDALPYANMKGKTSGGYILYKKGLAYYGHGNFDDAAKYLKQFTRAYPKNEFATEASTLLATLKVKSNGKQYRVGVVLPLTGRFALYGNSTLHGLQCAAGLTPPCNAPLNIELVVKDSGGNIAQTVAAIDELAKEGVVAIVGPLLSSTVEAAARRAQDLKIPLLTLSQKKETPNIGNYVFKHSLTPADQINTLVDFSRKRRKIKNYGILYPSNGYGAQYARLFRETVEANGGKIVYEKSYSHQDLRASESTKDLGSYTSIDGSKTDGFGKKFEVPSTVQALFIPDSYKAARYLVLAVHNDSPKLSPSLLFMGANRWNNHGLISHDIGLLEGSIFVAGFYSKSHDTNVRHFVQDFFTAYNIEPTVLEAQAYDALRLVMYGIKGGGTNRKVLRERIAAIKNYGGATGSINVGPNGETNRKLFVITVKSGAFAELSSGSRNFIVKDTIVSPSKSNSSSKYDGMPVPDLSVRTDTKKYEPLEFFDREMQ